MEWSFNEIVYVALQLSNINPPDHRQKQAVRLRRNRACRTVRRCKASAWVEPYSAPYRKVLFIELVRTITGQQFVDGLEETLLPRLRGKCAHELAQLKAVLAKHSMMLGSVFLVSVDGALLPDACLTADHDGTHHTEGMNGGALFSHWWGCPVGAICQASAASSSTSHDLLTITEHA